VEEIREMSREERVGERLYFIEASCRLRNLKKRQLL